MSRNAFFGVIPSLLLLAVASPAPAAPRAAGPAAVMTGNPAQIRLTAGGTGTCVRLQIAATRPARLLLTTAGLGRSRIAATAQCPSAASPEWKDRLIADFALPFRFRDVSILIDPALTEGADEVEGEIIAVDGSGGRVSAALTVNAGKPSPFLTALSWFFGLLAPALIAAGVTYLVAKRNRRETEAQAFDAFRQLQGARISGAFVELADLIKAEHTQRPGQLAHDILSKYGILESLPRKTLRKMTGYFVTNQLSAIILIMRQEFPAYAHMLDAKPGGG